MKIAIADSDDWELRRFHGRTREPGGPLHLHWKVTDLGILVAGEKAERRTKGEPVTVRRIVNTFGDAILKWADHFDLDEQLLAAIIAIESGGRPEAEREEKHLRDWSIGLTQVLTATAKHLINTFRELPQITTAPIPAGGPLEAWRGHLRNPDTSIGLGAAYLRSANNSAKLRSDPVLLYCAYNAGSVRADDNPWGLKHYRHIDKTTGKLTYAALDSFVAWYGDACAVYGTC